ncbi:MAG: hypothetical protein ACRC46_13360 [Thermoguttaceae bacterium]
MGLSLKRGLVLGSVAAVVLAASASGVFAADDVSTSFTLGFGTLFDSVGDTVKAAMISAFGVGAGVMVAFMVWRVIKRAGSSI